MSAEIGFEVDELIVDEVVSVLAGADDPSIALVQRPAGSLYLRTNGEVWQKTGALANQWVRLTTSVASGISESDHAALLQLIHFIDEGPAQGFATGATKTVTGTVFPTEELWKRADNTALVRKAITWTGVLPTTIAWTLYAANGTTVLATVTDTVTYSGVFESGRTRTIS